LVFNAPQLCCGVVYLLEISLVIHKKEFTITMKEEYLTMYWFSGKWSNADFS